MIYVSFSEKAGFIIFRICLFTTVNNKYFQIYDYIYQIDVYGKIVLK